MRLIGTLRRILTGDHDENVASERAIARTAPEPMPPDEMERWLDA